jgi:hypothetical protein
MANQPSSNDRLSNNSGGYAYPAAGQIGYLDLEAINPILRQDSNLAFAYLTYVAFTLQLKTQHQVT